MGIYSVAVLCTLSAKVNATLLVYTTDDSSDPLLVRFINNSPVVKDKTITVYVQTNKQTDAIYCQALGTTLGTVDCKLNALY